MMKRSAHFAGIVALALLVGACGSTETETETGAVTAGGAEARMGQSDITTLVTDDTRVGTGNEAVAGREVTVHYTGWLYDGTREDRKGTMFDSSLDGDKPFAFRLGAGEVIPGWDEGVAGMKVGGRRTLTIPPEYGYGSRGTPDGAIPPNSTLLFEVELLDVR